MCIPLNKVCNKIPDCPSGEDEPVDKCGVDECATNNGGCSHLCIDTPTSYRCDCRPGYKLTDNFTCDGMYLEVLTFKIGYSNVFHSTIISSFSMLIGMNNLYNRYVYTHGIVMVHTFA